MTGFPDGFLLSQQAITVAPAGAEVSKMASPQNAQTVMTTGGLPLAKAAGVPPTPLSSTPAAASAAQARVTVVSQVGARVQVHKHKWSQYPSEVSPFHSKQEMQENVKKCKNFLATLIKLASHNSPSPDTSKNVKALVQDLLVSCSLTSSPSPQSVSGCRLSVCVCVCVCVQDAKIEPEEFTTRLQAELKSSPQPYLIPFLKVRAGMGFFVEHKRSAVFL